MKTAVWKSPALIFKTEANFWLILFALALNNEP